VSAHKFTIPDSSTLQITGGGNIVVFSAFSSSGLSAYQVAVKNGFSGTEAEWLLSLTVPSASMPGEIKLYAGATAPGGWHLCDGSPLSRADCPDLFSVLGVAYGDGDGSTTFNLPDLRGNTVIGASASHALGASGGAESVTLSTSQLPVHTHTASVDISGITATSVLNATSNGTGFPYPSSNATLCNTGTGGPSGYMYLPTTGDATDLVPLNTKSVVTTVGGTAAATVNNSTGGGSAVSIMQPFAVLNYIIRLF
jgi:microcystin-dependent protein